MKLRKIYTSAGILLLSLFCIGDAVAKDAKFETGVSFGSTGADLYGLHHQWHYKQI